MRPSSEPVDPAFAYPSAPHDWKHGPRGYTDDANYKPFLRDEFDYRCVYCICREVWLADPSGSVEHLVPVSIAPAGLTAYETLRYSCSLCNASRKDQPLPLDPCCGLAVHLVVRADGSVCGSTPEGERLIMTCRLNRQELVAFRSLLLRVFAFLRSSTESAARDILRAYLGFPANLPDLSSLRPPGGNTRPGGIARSALARRERGELPETY